MMIAPLAPPHDREFAAVPWQKMRRTDLIDAAECLVLALSPLAPLSGK
jgi:hypothetical protein